MITEHVRLLEAHATHSADVPFGWLPTKVEATEVHYHVVAVGEALSTLWARMKHRDVVLVVCTDVLFHARLTAVCLVTVRTL
jgi:hypothetical protein